MNNFILKERCGEKRVELKRTPLFVANDDNNSEILDVEMSK